QTSEQGGESTANAGGAEKQFSQDDVNRMIKARAEREVQTMLRELGLGGVDELKGLVQAKRQAEDAEKSELQKANERAAQLEKQLADVAAKQKVLLTQIEYNHADRIYS
ncbi:MAG TPA: hypothetical protein PKW57_03790, partial [Anaerolineaceae bacterium]|nr:hypothetical protein [Anaerolineaceae bacterium]